MKVDAAGDWNLSLYGRLDLGLTDENDGLSPLAGGLNNSGELQMRHGSGNRVGLRGTSELGDGLSGKFQIEERLNVLTGEIKGGPTTLGLSGPFGTLTLGRDPSPAYDVALRADPWAFATIAQMGSGPTLAGASGLFENLLGLERTFGPFTAEAALSLSESAKPGASDGFGFRGVYAEGPLWLGVGHERPARGDAAAPDSDTWIGTGALKLGAAQLTGTYARGGPEMSRTHVGAGFSYDVGPGQWRAMVSRSEDDGAANQATTTKAGLGYWHTLSKDTSVYADVAWAQKDNNALDDLSPRWGWDLGIRHNFASGTKPAVASTVPVAATLPQSLPPTPVLDPPAAQLIATPPRNITVQPGQTLDGIARHWAGAGASESSVYALRDRFAAANPQLHDLNRLAGGQTLRFPDAGTLVDQATRERLLRADLEYRAFGR